MEQPADGMHWAHCPSTTREIEQARKNNKRVGLDPGYLAFCETFVLASKGTEIMENTGDSVTSLQQRKEELQKAVSGG